MILPFELSKIKFIVDSTNDLLVFETDSSISERFKQILEEEIDMLKHSKFALDFYEPTYKDFNDIIDQCIEALLDRVVLVDCGKISSRIILLDEKKYEKIVYKPN